MTTIRHQQSINGLSFSWQETGRGPALLLLHGFTGSSASWQPFFHRLAPFFRTIAVDLIGHGQTAAPKETTRYSMENCVADLLKLLDVLEIKACTIVGYSMGGRTALSLAAQAPRRCQALILESTSPGLRQQEERDRRRRADAKLAATIEEDGIAAFVHRWEQLPLFASQRQLPHPVQQALRRQRLSNRPTGLAGSLRGMGTGSMRPLHADLPQLDLPTLIMAGELDDKYVAEARAMAAVMPRAQLALVPGAGHNIHLEQPETFSRLLLSFLQRQNLHN